MTSNTAKLYRKIMNDKAAQAELAGIGDKAEGLEAIVRLGEAHGLPVTPEEVRSFLAREPGEELTDAELEMVVGGKGNPNENITGDDWAWIGLPNDNLDGGDGNDTIYGFTGNDTLSGGAGSDSMSGGQGNDTMSGGSGNDSMRGGESNDSMSGDAGDDSMDGGDGYDRMSGGDGNDFMDGGDDADTMSGGAGQDDMFGGEGFDVMDGGVGNDTMDGGGGYDTLSGGAGNDVFVFRMDDGNDTITDFNPQEDRLLLQGAEAGDIDVRTQNGNTVVTYGQTVITLEGVEMTKDEVWERVRTS